MKKNKYANKIYSAGLIVYMIIFILNGFYSNEVYADMPSPVTNQASFISWLIKTGRPAYSRYHGYAANYSVYYKYHLLSYGTPDSVPGNRYDKAHDEYAMHGFSYDEYQVTNTYFRDDTNGISDPRKWNNMILGQDAEISWMRLTAREKEHIHNSVLFYQGKDYGGISFADLKLTEQKCVVVAVPSWNLGFALYTRHYNSRHEIRYGTLHGNGIGGVEIDGEIKVSDDTAGGSRTIQSGQEYIDIAFMIDSYISGYIGLARSSDIEKGGIIFNGKEYETNGSGLWKAKQVIRYARNADDPSRDFSRKVTVKAVVWVVSRLGDLTFKEMTYTFTIIEKAKINIKGVFTIKGAISLFDGKKTILGYQLPYNPKRFLCLEKLTMRIDFEGRPLPQSVVFYPLGGNPVTVPIVKINDAKGYAQHIYILGIMSSSIKWDNNRIRASYYCSASAYSNSVRTDYIIDGIDITGDIYDLVYLQSPR
ncbi:MAG: hypothetical protein ACYCYI_13700 [Saccharofermentanales bacterium]